MSKKNEYVQKVHAFTDGYETIDKRIDKKHCLNNSYVHFGDKYYKQTVEVAMGSRADPPLAIVFMNAVQSLLLTAPTSQHQHITYLHALHRRRSGDLDSWTKNTTSFFLIINLYKIQFNLWTISFKACNIHNNQSKIQLKHFKIQIKTCKVHFKTYTIQFNLDYLKSYLNQPLMIYLEICEPFGV